MTTGVIEEPISSRNKPAFFTHSLSVSPTSILESQSVGKLNFELETGDLHDAFYISNVNEVACTNEICNKRISNEGQQWSAGRLGNRPTGARDAACNSQTCLGPYAAHELVQLTPTGHNTHEENEASSRRPQREEQDNTNQPAASSSRRPAAKDRMLPATAALQLRRPPYFIGGADEDVHVWTSIISRWLDAVQGEPSRQLTYVVSLLRGAAFEWYSSMETHTECPGDWTT